LQLSSCGLQLSSCGLQLFCLQLPCKVLPPAWPLPPHDR
jgi:hypothetical protein